MTTPLQPLNGGPRTDGSIVGRAAQRTEEPLCALGGGPAILRALPGPEHREPPGAYRARLRPALAALSWEETCTLLGFLVCDVARLEGRVVAWQEMQARQARALLRAARKTSKGGVPCLPGL